MRKLVLAAAAAVVVLLLAAALLIPALVDVESHRPAIESALASATGRRVALGPLRLRLLPRPALAGAGIEIAEDPAIGGEPFLKAASFEIRIRLLPLLAGKVAVASMRIDAPAIRLRRARDRSWSLATLGAAGPPGAPAAGGAAAGTGGAGSSGAEGGGAIAFAVDRLVVTGGTLTLTDEGLSRGGPQTLEARGIALTVSDLSTTTPVGVDLALEMAGGGRARLTGRVGPPPGMTGGAWPIDARLVLDGFRGGAAAPWLEAFTGIRLHGGTIDLDAEVKGKAPESLALAGEASLRGLEIDPLAGGGARVRLDGKIALEGVFTPDATTLGRAGISVGRSRVDLSGTLADLRSRPRMDVRVSAARALLADVAGVLRLFGPLLPAGLGTAGEIALEASVKGPLDDPAALAIDGKATISGFEYADAALAAPIREIEGTVTFSGGRAEISGFGAALGRSRVAGSCVISRFARPVIDVRLAGPLVDLDEVLSLLKPAAPRASRARPDAQPAVLLGKPPRDVAPARLEAAAPSVLGTITVRGEVAAEEIRILNLRLTAARGRVLMEEGTARLDDVALSLYGGTLEGSGSAALSEAGPPFGLSARLQGVDVNALASDFSPDLKGILHGTLESALSAQGRGLDRPSLRRNLAGEGAVALRDGKLTSFGLLATLAKALKAAGGSGIGEEETPFDSLTGTFRIGGGRATTEDLRLESADILLKGKGHVTLDLALDLDVGARIRPEVSASMIATTPGLKYLLDDKGRLAIDCKVGGSVLEPSVGVDPATLRRAARAAMKEQTAEKGREILDRLLDKKRD